MTDFPRETRHRGHAEHRPPADCPVCGDRLSVTRLGCPSCGTELSGRFESCPYCSLTEAEEKILRVFLVSRGNMKDLERHLGVSYPTARQRFADLLTKLGLEPASPRPPSRDEILRRVAAGEMTIDEATSLLTD